MLGYYSKRSQATADLKRTAHAVRQRVDALPVEGSYNPRKARYIARSSMVEPGKEPPREAPYLSPHARHRWAWGGKWP